MNERIKELAEQADLYARSDNSSMIFENYQKRYTEKFVELIVQECITVIENKMPNFTCKEDYENLIRKAGRMDAIDEIKEHFGVEE